MIKKTAVISCFLFFCFYSFGQDNSTGKSNKKKGPDDVLLAINVGGALGDTKKAVQNNMGNLGFGLSLEMLWDPFRWGGGKGPVRIGGDIGYSYYGRFKSDVDINGYHGDYKTSYGIGRINGILRFRPTEEKNFVPFADVFAGGNLYMADTKENLNAIETALGFKSVSFGGKSSFGFNKGIGAGFSARVGKEDFVKLRVSGNWGTPVYYVVRNSVTYDAGSNRLVYQTGRAKLNYILVEFGIGF